MRIAPLTDQSRNTIERTTLRGAREALRPLLLQGKTDQAIHELRILLDRGADDMTHVLLKVIAALLKSNSVEARYLMETTSKLGIDDGKRYTYNLLLIETAMCIALSNGDPAVTTIATAEASRGLSTHSEEAVGTQGVQILHQLATGDVAMARITHGNLTNQWLTTESPVIIEWIQIIDLAIYRATRDKKVLQKVLSSKRPNLFALSQACELERKFRKEDRRPKWLNRAIGLVLKKH